MIPFTLSKDISFELPQDYGELTLKQFYDLRKVNGDILDVLSILSGLSREIWEQARDFDIDVKITPYLTWMYEKFDESKFVLSDKLTIGDKELSRPKQIKTQTFGQKLALEKSYNEAAAKGGAEIDLIPYSIALYFQPSYFDGKYNSDQVDELLPLVMNLKVQDAFPIGSFFLLSYAKLLNSKERDFRTFLVRKKRELELIALQNSENLERSTILQRVLVRIMNRLSLWIITLFSLRYGMNLNSQPSKGGLVK